MVSGKGSSKWEMRSIDDWLPCSLWKLDAGGESRTGRLDWPRVIGTAKLTRSSAIPLTYLRHGQAFAGGATVPQILNQIK